MAELVRYSMCLHGKSLDLTIEICSFRQALPTGAGGLTYLYYVYSWKEVIPRLGLVENNYNCLGLKVELRETSYYTY